MMVVIMVNGRVSSRAITVSVRVVDSGTDWTLRDLQTELDRGMEGGLC